MLEEGFYESIINAKIQKAIEKAEENDLECISIEIDKNESERRLTDYLTNKISEKLKEFKNLSERIEFINKILDHCEMQEEKITANSKNLLMEVKKNGGDLTSKKPYNGFIFSTLFTGGDSSLHLLEELKRDIETADEIYFVVSFLRTSGVDNILGELKQFCSCEDKKLRIITTTYCGITESKAIQKLHSLPNTEIKVAYNTDKYPLHAKAYIFKRNSGADTAYIGSSNLSLSAQTNGREWNVRFTKEENPYIINEALNEFNRYWNNSDFETFDEKDLEKFETKSKEDNIHFKTNYLKDHEKLVEKNISVEESKGFETSENIKLSIPLAVIYKQLKPFYYHCIGDRTDLSEKSLWDGYYIEEKLKDKLCTDERGEAIVNAIINNINDTNTCQALCYCLNAEHANFMVEQFNSYGLKAQSLTSEEETAKSIEKLHNGEVNFLCVVDIPNIKIPEFDTILFLCPTKSVKLFIEQLKYGLCFCQYKEQVTILDFIFKANAEYDYAGKFRALSLKPGKNIKEQLKDFEQYIPKGCSFEIDNEAWPHILKNIKAVNKKELIKILKAYSGIPTLEEFLEDNGLDIRFIYKKNNDERNCWTSLKREASLISYKNDEITEQLAKGMKYLIHHNSVSFLRFVREFINGSDSYKNKENTPYTTLLYYNLYSKPIGETDFHDMYEALAKIHDKEYGYFKQEISEIVSYLLSHMEITTKPLGEDILPCVELYGNYSIEDVMILVGKQTENNKVICQSGVYKFNNSTYFLFVSLNKDKKDYKENFRYDDHVVNENCFHWQSKDKESHLKPGGKKYTNQKEYGYKFILFVRKDKEDDFGNTPAYHCFGSVNYSSSKGDCPMNIEWELENPIMPRYL